MALMRIKELRDLPDEELRKKERDLGVELARERGGIRATGKPSNPGKFKQMRKTIARIHTIIGERARKSGAKKPVEKIQVPAAAAPAKSASAKTPPAVAKPAGKA